MTDIDYDHVMQMGQKAIDALPDNAAEVARALGAEGVKGLCFSPWNCAIAEYMNLHAPVAELEGATWTVQPGVAIPFPDEGTPGTPRGVMLPPAVRDFIWQFDDGRYPELTK